MDIRVVTVNGVREEVIILSPSEQETWYNDCVNRVINDTRFYLDNLDFLPSFKVNWLHYGKKRRKTFTKPKSI